MTELAAVPDTAEPLVVSPVVATFLLQIVNSVQLPAAADNFEEQAALIVQAKKELAGGRN